MTTDTTPSTSSGPSGLWRRWRRALIGTVAVLAGLTWLLSSWLPQWLRPKVEQAAAQALGTPVSIGQIDIRPWTGWVMLDALTLGPQSAPMLKLAHAQVQLSLESIWRLTPVLRRVSLDKPELFVERQSEARFNFSSVLDKLATDASKSPPSSEPTHFAVFNIEVRDGRVRYVDKVLQQEHVIEQVHIGVPFVSNLPSFVAVDVKPRLSARVDGSPLVVEGDALPFAQELRSTIRLQWRDVDLAHWLAVAQPFLPDDWKMQAQSGRLQTDLQLQFEARKPPQLPHLAITGGLKIEQVALSLPHAPGLGQVDAGFHLLDVQGLDAQPLAQQVKVGSVLLDGVQWRNRLLQPKAASGRDKLQLTPDDGVQVPPASAAPKPKEPPPAQPWQWAVDRIKLEVGRVDVQTQATQAWPAIASLRVTVEGLNSQPKAKPASWQLSLRDEHEASLEAQGQVQVTQQMMEARFDLARLAIGSWMAPVADSLGLPVRIEQGALGLQGQVQARLVAASALEPAQLRLLSGRVSVQQLDAKAVQKALPDRIRLDELLLEGVQAQVDLAGSNGAPSLQSLSMDKLALSKLDGAITRGAKGEWMGMTPSAGEPPRAPASKVSTPAAKPAPITLKELVCSACQWQMTDQSVSPAAKFEVHQTQLRLADLSSDLSRPIALELDTLAQGKGRVQLKGAVQPQPLKLDARVRLASLDLRGIQPYIDPLVNVTLAGLKAQADGQLNVQMPRSERDSMQVRYKGRVGLSDVRVLDRVNEADFLSWQALTLDGADLGIRGDAVDANLGRISLKDFYGRIIINPDGRLNLAGILRRESGAEAKSLTTPESAASAPAAAVAAAPSSPSGEPVASKPAPLLRWQQITLSKGRVDFTDNFVKPNYSARLTQIEGDVSAVSSNKPEPATVKVSGAVDDAAPLLISGQLHPLGPKLFTDIEGSAKGIELTRLTPYASRYAGYAIEKGTLSVKVHYKVDGGKLDASNQIFLDQLTFGEKTDSPDATKLPVQFAVSLLKNSKGEIDINLPISGSLDDPEFSVGGIIWRVLVNLITKAVTAPFSLLAGGGSDELGYVAFEPGQSELTPASRQSLDKLIDKLADRPALKLEATGRADPQADTEGLRRTYVASLMRTAKARATGQSASEVDIAEAERSTWLAAAYKAADIKKPRNLIGMAKTLPDAEMEALLKAAAPVGPETLRALANQRGDQVKAYMARKLPPERLLLTASKVGVEGLPEDKGPSTRVQFEVR